MENKTIEQAEKELREARDYFDECHQNASVARSRETSAINRLNEAQKAFDRVVADMKKEAPFQSDWKSRQGRAEAA